MFWFYCQLNNLGLGSMVIHKFILPLLGVLLLFYKPVCYFETVSLT